MPLCYFGHVMDVYQRRRLVALSVLVGVFVILVLLIRSCGGDDERDRGDPGRRRHRGRRRHLAEPSRLRRPGRRRSASRRTPRSPTVDESDPEQAATEQGQILAGELESLQTPAAARGRRRSARQVPAARSRIRSPPTTSTDHRDRARRRHGLAELDATIEEAAAEAGQGGGQVRLRGLRRPLPGRRIERWWRRRRRDDHADRDRGSRGAGDPDDAGRAGGPDHADRARADRGRRRHPAPAPTAPAPTDDGSGSGGDQPLAASPALRRSGAQAVADSAQVP